jgi:hypothetical protein
LTKTTGQRWLAAAAPTGPGPALALVRWRRAAAAVLLAPLRHWPLPPLRRRALPALSSVVPRGTGAGWCSMHLLVLALYVLALGEAGAVNVGDDPFGECEAYGHLAFSSPLFDTCPTQAQFDSTQAQPLGPAFCPTGCSSFDATTGQHLCCNAGCCRCGGVRNAIDTSEADHPERGNYVPTSQPVVDAWGVCSGSGQPQLDRRMESQRCASGCVGYGLFPEVFVKGFRAADHVDNKICTLVANQIWTLAKQANESSERAVTNATEYLEWVWARPNTFNTSHNTTDSTWSNLHVDPALMHLIFPWDWEGYFLRGWCVLEADPNSHGWPLSIRDADKWPSPIKNLYPLIDCLLDAHGNVAKMTACTASPGIPGVTPGVPGPIFIEPNANDPLGPWNNSHEHLRQAARVIDDTDGHPQLGASYLPDTCDAAIHILCPQPLDETEQGRPGTYSTPELCDRCVANTGQVSLRRLWVDVMCGPASGHKDRYPYLATTQRACRRDQAPLRGAPICCKSSCCLQPEWYERWEYW